MTFRTPVENIWKTYAMLFATYHSIYCVFDNCQRLLDKECHCKTNYSDFVKVCTNSVKAALQSC